jgi:hypothetical protein
MHGCQPPAKRVGTGSHAPVSGKNIKIADK